MSVKVLDYKNARLYMEVESEFEETYRILACGKEPWTVAFIDSLPPEGMLWDIGANVGSYTLVAASRGMKVVAVEPMGESYGRLCHNLSLNGMRDKVVAIHGACGPVYGFEWLNLADARVGAGNHMMGQVNEHVTHRQQVLQYPLDMLLKMVGYAGPHYMKLDVDGSEEQVLAGAPEFLSVLTAAIVEMAVPLEASVTATMAAAGLTLRERFTEREGKSMDIVYGLFGR